MLKLSARQKNERTTNQPDEEIDRNFNLLNDFVELDVVSLDAKSNSKSKVVNKSYLNDTEPGTPRSTIHNTRTPAAENSSLFKTLNTSQKKQPNMQESGGKDSPRSHRSNQKPTNSLIVQNFDQYSEGESGSEFTVKISQLKPNAKLQRIMFLWKKAYLRSRGAASILILINQIKHSILTYGSTKHLSLKERGRIKLMNQKVPWFVLIPQSKYRMSWNIIMVLFIMLTATYTPYRIAFITEDTIGDMYIDLILDVYFILDIVLSIFTAYPDPITGVLITNINSIVKHYVKGDLFFDIIASFPFSILDAAFGIQASGAGTNVAKLAKLPRLYRLAKILRLMKISSILQHSSQISNFLDSIMVNFAVMRLIKTFFGVAFSIHLMGCLWFFVSTFAEDSNNWTVLTSDSLGHNIIDKNPIYQYLISVYWAEQTITTVGYGDLTIGMVEEFILGSFWIFFGASFYSFLVGNISNIIVHFDQKVAQLQMRLGTLQRFALRVNLPSEVSIRIQRFLENKNKDNSNVDQQQELEKNLPPSIRKELEQFAFNAIVKDVIFFRDKDVHFLKKVIMKLRQIQIYTEEILYSERDTADDIYFLLNGEITLYIDISELTTLPEGTIDNQSQSFNVPIIKQKSGGYFGDHDCLRDLDHLSEKKWTRQNTCEAVLKIEVAALKKNDLDILLQSYPSIRKYMHRLALEKQRYYQSLQVLILNRYKDLQKIDELIYQRMKKPFITTYLSLQSQLKKKHQYIQKQNNSLSSRHLPKEKENSADGKNHLTTYSKQMKTYIFINSLEENANVAAESEDSISSEDEFSQKKNIIQDVFELSQISLEQNVKKYCNNMSKLSLSAYQLTKTADEMFETAMQSSRAIQNVEDQLDFAIEKQRSVLKMLEQRMEENAKQV